MTVRDRIRARAAAIRRAREQGQGAWQLLSDWLARIDREAEQRVHAQADARRRANLDFPRELARVPGGEIVMTAGHRPASTLDAGGSVARILQRNGL